MPLTLRYVAHRGDCLRGVMHIAHCLDWLRGVQHTAGSSPQNVVHRGDFFDILSPNFAVCSTPRRLNLRCAAHHRNNFVNESLDEIETEFKILQHVYQGPILVRIMKKTGERKSRDTLPVNKFPPMQRIVFVIILLYYYILLLLYYIFH